MKFSFSFLFLYALSSFFFFSESHLIAETSSSLFQTYLAAYRPKNMENQPVYLRNTCREKESDFTEMTILEVKSMMRIDMIAERVLYGNADVIHVANISLQKAAYLYEMFQHTYSHFIHVPYKGRGEFIASKYPLSQVKITQYEQENAICKEILEFAIQGANIHRASISLDDSSMQLGNRNDIGETTVLLGDLPAALTVVNQEFTPFQNAQKIDLIAKDTFNLITVSRGGGRDHNDSSGPYCEGRVDFKSGPNGTEWSVSGRAGYEDERGNYVEGQVSRNDRGETSGSARAGHDKDK